MERVEKLIELINAVGEGAYVESLAFHSNNDFTVKEIQELSKKYPNWIMIKNDKVYTDEVRFANA